MLHKNKLQATTQTTSPEKCRVKISTLNLATIRTELRNQKQRLQKPHMPGKPQGTEWNHANVAALLAVLRQVQLN